MKILTAREVLRKTFENLEKMLDEKGNERLKRAGNFPDNTSEESCSRQDPRECMGECLVDDGENDKDS
jgi:hypothetical protein